MGLDMYLNAEEYLGGYDEESKVLIQAIKENAYNGLNEHKPKSVTFELGYWRKANAIHGWFVKNVQDAKDDCNSYYVSLEKLEELKQACQKVLANIELANELLPATKGFFFGDDSYDEYYEQDLHKTILICNKILSNPAAQKLWITYRASW